MTVEHLQETPEVVAAWAAEAAEARRRADAAQARTDQRFAWFARRVLSC